MIPSLFTGGSLIAPGAALISSGYVAGNTLGAQHFNWYLNHLTMELNAVLTAGSITQNSAVDTQVRDAIQNMINSAVAASAAISAPSGSVKMFAGAAAPSGWLMCDGSAVSRTTYATLFGVIGTAFGVGDGSTTFNLPDMREAAPVGVGTFAAVTGTTHGAITAHDAFTLGQFKDDQGQGHQHSVTWSTTTVAGNQQIGSSTANSAAATNTSSPVTDGVNGTPRMGTVTRGKRLGLNFIIKT